MIVLSFSYFSLKSRRSPPKKNKSARPCTDTNMPGLHGGGRHRGAPPIEVLCARRPAPRAARSLQPDCNLLSGPFCVIRYVECAGRLRPRI